MPRKTGKSSTAASTAPSPQPAVLRRRLLAWYDVERRDLPWRRTRDPYAIWISESMLQQTQVATVIPYYEGFLARFPTVSDLAAAPIDDVLQRWAGLGYYARARNLHRAAQDIVTRFGGRIPDTVESLLKLPGIGRYTAGAVASIAFERRAAVVDGNVARVLSRIFRIDADIKTPAGDRAVWAAATSLLPRRRVGDFNQALMELGATTCLPGAAARCGECPLRRQCAAARVGAVARLPVRGKKTPVKKESHVVVALERGGRHLFRRRPSNGLWAGLWELPTAVRNGETAYIGARRLLRSLDEPAGKLERTPCCSVEQQLTHRLIRFDVFAVRSAPGSRRNGWAANARWVRLESSDDLGMSAAMRRIVDALIAARAGTNGRRRRNAGESGRKERAAAGKGTRR